MPQASVFGSVLYLLYMSYLQQPEEAIVVTFSDATAIMAVGDSLEETNEKLQRAINKKTNGQENV